MTPLHRRTRRAFATTMALALVALVAVAVAALTSRLATAARIARTDREQTQLRQLLLAATDHARTTPQPGRHTLPLPPSLVEQGATVTWTTSANQTRIEARLGKSAMTQIVAADGTVRLE